MAEAEDTDISNCPICFEPYETTGKHVPRILPCHHTLCDGCIKGLLKNDIQQRVTCPECRMNHPADNQLKTFPQNKYVITYIVKIKKLAEANERTEKCAKHSEEAGLYCRNEECQTPICQRCLLTEHKTHNFGDINEERTRKKKSLLEMAKLTGQRLQIQKQRLSFAQSEVERYNSRCVKNLENTKKEVIKAVTAEFDELIVFAKFPTISINNEKDELEKQLGDVNRIIKDDEKKFEKIGSICNKLGKMAQIEAQLKAKMDLERKFDFMEYRPVEIREIVELCSKLRIRKKAAGLHTLKDGLLINQQYDNVICLRAFSDGSIMILGDSNGERKLTRCTIENGKVVCNPTPIVALKDAPNGMAECRPKNKSLFALPYRDAVTIDFYTLDEPMTKIFSHTLSPNSRPGHLYSVWPGSLFVEDTSKEPRWVMILDCAASPPTCRDVILTQQQSIHDMCRLSKSGRHLLVTSHMSQGLMAYDMKSGKAVWRIRETVLGLDGDMVPQSIVADDQGNLFVSDINNDMVHKFSSDGTFLGSVLCNVGEAKISWSSTASTLLVLYRRGHQWYLKVCDDELDNPATQKQRKN